MLHMVMGYPEGDGFHASGAMMSNYECVPAGAPVAIRRNGYVDIVDIADLVPHRTDPRSGHRYTTDGGNLEAWDGSNWVRCIARTASWHAERIAVLHGRGAIVSATNDHVVFLNGGTAEKRAGEVSAGEQLWVGAPPASGFTTVLTVEEARLLGYLVAEGWVSEAGRGRVTCGDEAVLAETAELWGAVMGGIVSKEQGCKSAFSDSRTPSIRLVGHSAYLRMLRSEIYSRRDRHKRIPPRVLNAAPHLKAAFLESYNRGDGLRAGSGTDEFRSFRTNSPVLATGLIWLARTTLGRAVSIYYVKGH